MENQRAKCRPSHHLQISSWHIFQRSQSRQKTWISKAMKYFSRFLRSYWPLSKSWTKPNTGKFTAKLLLGWTDMKTNLSPKSRCPQKDRLWQNPLPPAISAKHSAPKYWQKSGSISNYRFENFFSGPGGLSCLHERHRTQHFAKSSKQMPTGVTLMAKKFPHLKLRNEQFAHLISRNWQFTHWFFRN